jgi:hypothetical protein
MSSSRSTSARWKDIVQEELAVEVPGLWDARARLAPLRTIALTPQRLPFVKVSLICAV